jgi:hypothetical protein
MEAESYPIIVRSFEPVADLDDRPQRIFTVLSLPPLEDLSAQGTLHHALRARQRGGRAAVGDGFWGQVRGF